MNGRIIRNEPGGAVLDFPEVGRLKIGKKAVGNSGREYPTSVDYFIPHGKYADLFTQALGEKPQTVQVIFLDDNAEKVCNERYEYRDFSGALVAYGNGRVFFVWDGTRYSLYSTDEHPDIMQRIASKYPTRRGADNWDITLTLRFLIPAVRGVMGVWYFSTKGAASSIKNIRNSFDSVQLARGTVTTTVFDLSVHYHKSNKPGQTTKYPVVDLVANDNRIAEIRKEIAQTDSINLLRGGEQ